MSRRRKHGQGSRYQQDRRTGTDRGGPVPLSEALATSVPDLALAQLFRSECSRCGWRQLRWFPGSEASTVLGTDCAVDLLREMPAEYRQVAECWQCESCGECGAFGPSEWEPF